MRHSLAALLFATPICAFAVPALAQNALPAQPGRRGYCGAVPGRRSGDFRAVRLGGWNTEAATTGAPAYSYSTMPP